MKSIFQRALTPVLTVLIAALGMVATISMSRMQGKAQAFFCNQPTPRCTGSGVNSACEAANVNNPNCAFCSLGLCTHS